jgi:hypothetical protein
LPGDGHLATERRKVYVCHDLNVCDESAVRTAL